MIIKKMSFRNENRAERMIRASEVLVVYFCAQNSNNGSTFFFKYGWDTLPSKKMFVLVRSDYVRSN